VKFLFLCLSRKGCCGIGLLEEPSTKIVISLKFCVSWYFFSFLFYVLILFLIHHFYLVYCLSRECVVVLGDERSHKKVFAVAVMIDFRKRNDIQVCQLYTQLC
jgi:hypothetical protein